MSASVVLFFSLAAALSIGLALVVLYPWLKSKPIQGNRLMALNVATFYERLAELDNDQQSGLITPKLYEAQVIELKRQLLAAQTQTASYGRTSPKSRMIVLIWIPLLMGLAYLVSGDRTAVMTFWQGQDKVAQVADDLMTAKIDTPPEWAISDSTALISAMQTNVYRHADDANRWMRLSELFLSLDAKEQALQALSRAYRLDPNNDEIASTYAQVSFFANEGQLDNQSRVAIADVLASNPNHEGAMMLMAMGETRAGNYDEARLWVNRLRASITSKAGDHSSALQSLDKLVATIDEQAQKASQSITVNVAIDAGVLGLVAPSDVLFVAIIGDTTTGDNAPYAVARLPASQLQNGTATLILSDNNAMMPKRTLSLAKQQNIPLFLTAKLSKSGNAISQPGDLMAAPIVVPKTANTLDITINQIVP